MIFPPQSHKEYKVGFAGILLCALCDFVVAYKKMTPKALPTYSIPTKPAAFSISPRNNHKAELHWPLRAI
jgi:hypothetical protein